MSRLRPAPAYRWVGQLAVILLLSGLSGCGPGARPNVLLVVIDTARADRLSVDGYARQTSPEIAKLAREGVVYEQAYTPAPWTLPAHASLFTGLYPSSHGADSGHMILEDRLYTLAEAFHDAGYRTAAYAGNPWVGRQYGFGQGFDSYEEAWQGTSGDEEDAGASRLNSRIGHWLEWRESSPTRDQPFFMFINYLEPHLPYNPPEPERSRFLAPGTDTADVERLRRFGHPQELRYVLGQDGLRPGDLAILSDLYDGEIAYLDRRVGEVAGFLRARRLLDETVVVITSDHGEAIGDHGFLDHKLNVFEEVLRIPLVLRYPRAIAAGQRVAGPVMLQDLYPTLLGLAGIRPRVVAPGGDQAAPEAVPLPGVAGLPRSDPRSSPAIISEFARPIQFLEIMQQTFPETRIESWDRALVAYRAGGEKLHWASNGRHRLYDLTRDPAEEHDLAATRPERVAALAAQVEAWLRRPAARPPLALPSH